MTRSRRSRRRTAWRCLHFAAAVLLAACNTAVAAPVPDDFVQSSSTYLDVLRHPELLASAQTFQQLMQHKHSLSRGSLQRSLVYKGATLRLRKVLNKLQASGQHVSIGVIGGSVSWGHMVKKDVEDWFTLFASWLNSSFPAAKLTFRNGCVPATQSEYVSMCLGQFVDAGVDLIFVEYATNDGYTAGPIDNAPVRGFERLLRKLLQLRNAPAVCLMEFIMTDAKQKRLPFYATAEDSYGVLAQYYGLPWLSYRNAVWHGLMSDIPGFGRHEIFPAEDERHPTPLGHKYMADIAVNLLQQAYLDSMLVPMSAALLEQHRLAQVPPPMFFGNYEGSNLACIIGDRLKSVVVQNTGNWTWVNDGTAAKPKWGYVSVQVGATLVLKVDTRAMVYSSDVNGSTNVTVGSSSRPNMDTVGNSDSVHGTGAAALMDSSVASTIASSSAAEHHRHSSSSGSHSTQHAVTGGTPAGATQDSRMASSDGSSSGQLLAAASADAAAATEKRFAAGSAGDPDMIIWVGYLKSWQPMGSAVMSCIQDCQCESVLVNAMHLEANTQQHMAKLYATQAAECLVAIQINSWAQTQHHRFKVTGIMVSHRIDYNSEGDFTEEMLMDSMGN